MTDDRDRYRRKSPPAGVQAQLAPSDGTPELLDSYPRTGVIEKPVTGNETAVQAFDRRMRETKNTAIETLVGVEALRRDVREDVKSVDGRVTHLAEKLDALVGVVAEVRVEIAGGARQNDLIIRMLDDQNKARERSGMMRLTERTTQLELGKARALSEIGLEEKARLAEIEAIAASRSLWRSIIGSAAAKAIAFAAALGAAAIAGGYVFNAC